MTDLRIQIVNYGTKPYLIECLRSLFESLESNTISVSVAVLDNASGDDLTDLSERFPDDRLQLFHSDRNLGFGAGHNFLAKQGDAGHLFLLNPDTRIIEARTVESLLQYARDSGAQVVGPRLVTPEGRTQRWDHGELGGWVARLASGSGNSYWRERSAAVPAAWVAGAAFLIDKRWFDDLGGFDERFFLYKEEEELCLRIRARGGTVVYAPTWSVFHHCGVVARKSEHLRRSTDLFLEKHFRDRLGYPLFRLINRILH